MHLNCSFLYGAETWTLRKVDQKYLVGFEIVLLEKDGEDQLDRSREKRRSRTLRGVKEDRNIERNLQWKKTNWIGHILHRNRLLKRIIERKVEGKMEVRGRGGRRRKKLLDDLEGTEIMLEMKEETLDLTLGGTCWKQLQITEWMTVCMRTYGS